MARAQNQAAIADPESSGTSDELTITARRSWAIRLISSWISTLVPTSTPRLGSLRAGLAPC